MKKKNNIKNYLTAGLASIAMLGAGEAKSQIIEEVKLTKIPFDVTLNLGLNDDLMPRIGAEGSFGELHAGFNYSRAFTTQKTKNHDITQRQIITGKLGVTSKEDRFSIYGIVGKDLNTKQNLETMIKTKHSDWVYGAGMGLRITNTIGLYVNTTITNNIKINKEIGLKINIYGTYRDMSLF